MLLEYYPHNVDPVDDEEVRLAFKELASTAYPDGYIAPQLPADEASVFGVVFVPEG
jgi:hypothetical protein